MFIFLKSLFLLILDSVDTVSFCIILQLVPNEKPTSILVIARGTTPQRKLNHLSGYLTCALSNWTSTIGGYSVQNFIKDRFVCIGTAEDQGAEWHINPRECTINYIKNHHLQNASH
jgi:hypothetical protein